MMHCGIRPSNPIWRSHMKSSKLICGLNLAPLTLMLLVSAAASASDTFLDCEVVSGKQVYDVVERIEIFDAGSDEQNAVIWIQNENYVMNTDPYGFSEIDYKKGTTSISSYAGETFYSGARGDDRSFSLEFDMKNTKTPNGRLDVTVPLRGSSTILDSHVKVTCEEKNIQDRAKHANYQK